MSIVRATEFIEIVVQGEYAVARRHYSQSPCPRCHDMGFITRHNKQGYGVSTRCRCWGLDQCIKAFNQARLPARYYNAYLEGFLPRHESGKELLWRAHDFAWSFIPQTKGILIYGGYGTGKTYLAVSIVRILTLLRGYSVRFIEFSHLLSELQSTFNAPQHEKSRIMNQLIQTDCLVIDELGEGRQSDWTQSVLEELITKRYNASGSTLITTNYDPRLSKKHEANHLEERIGARIYSRLQQMCTPLPLFGSDYRSEIKNVKSI